MKEKLLKRYEKNPILAPDKNNAWESVAVFNCGAVYKDDLVHLLYRAIGEHKDYISRLGYGVSSDGFNFERKNKPVFEPLKSYERWGCEDPRITELEDRFYITYVTLSEPMRKRKPSRTALASTKDFRRFKRHGIITPYGADDRDVVLFPEKIEGKYVMLHRPANWTKENVYRKDGKLYLKMKGKTIRWPLKEIPNYFPQKPSIWIADNLKDKCLVNLMDQYRPCWQASKFPEINRRITKEEFEEAVEYAKSLGLNFIT